jgi:hypothetical protein
VEIAQVFQHPHATRDNERIQLSRVHLIERPDLLACYPGGLNQNVPPLVRRFPRPVVNHIPLDTVWGYKNCFGSGLREKKQSQHRLLNIGAITMAQPTEQDAHLRQNTSPAKFSAAKDKLVKNFAIPYKKSQQVSL